MFYAHFVLAKKGPLARIWLAAHWDKKLTKAHVFETNIETSVDGILKPKVKMALRTSGHLLLGVVRIYSRKAKYLLADCNEAFVKIKMAFRPGMVDLPEEHREAAVNAITLPEVFHDFDSAMPELNDVDIEAQFTLNQSRAEEITMREDYGNITLVAHDDGFGDMGAFDADHADLMRSPHSLEPSLDQANLLFSDGPSVDLVEDKDLRSAVGSHSIRSALEMDAPIRDDGFGGNLGQDIIAGGLFEGGLFDDAPMGDVTSVDTSSLLQSVNLGHDKDLSVARDLDSDDDMGDHYDAAPSPRGSSNGDSRPGTGLGNLDSDNQLLMPEALTTPDGAFLNLESSMHHPMHDSTISLHLPEDHMAESSLPDQTTLLQNEEESFALAPVDASALKGFTKAKRKRKLIVDETKNISGEEMKSQLSDTTDIVTTLDLAPPTKRLMHWKETGGVEKLFALPGRSLPARCLFKNYQRHLTSRTTVTEDQNIDLERDPMPLEGMEDLPAAPQPEVAAGRTTRASRKRKLQDQEDVPPAQRRAVEEDEDELRNLVQAPMLSGHNSMLEPQTPLEHLDQTPNGPMSMAPSYIDPNTPGGPLSVAPSYIDPQTPGGPLSMAPSYIDPNSVAGSYMDPHNSVAPSYLDPNTPAPNLEHEIPELPIDQVNMLLNTHEQSLGMQTPVTSGVPHQPELTAEQQAMMENVGYDHQDAKSYLRDNRRFQHDNQLMANMGYDSQADHQLPAMTPGAVSERGPNTPWNNDDYEFPHSAGPPDEQQTDETYEQFEERVLNKRAAHMYSVIKSKLETKEVGSGVFLSELTFRNNRKQAAQKFYTMLVLKKHQVLELQQNSSYEEIHITRGNKFDNPCL